MKLDSLLLVSCTIFCAVYGAVTHGTLLQCIILILLTTFNQIFTESSGKDSSTSAAKTTSAAAISQETGNFIPKFRFGVVGLFFPLLLAAEKCYYLTHAVGYSSLPFYASVFWMWVCFDSEHRLRITDYDRAQLLAKKHEHSSSSDISQHFWKNYHFLRTFGIILDKTRAEFVLIYSASGALAFLLLSFNINLALGIFFYIVCGYITEILLRELFHSVRVSLRQSANSSVATNLEKQQQLNSVDSEIHLVSSLVGWIVCDCASNPFQVSLRDITTTSTENSISANSNKLGSTKTVTSATPEMVVGRSIFIACWLGLVIFSLLRRRNQIKNYRFIQQQQLQQSDLKKSNNKSDNNKNNNNNSGDINNNNNSNSRKSIVYWFVGLISFVAAISLFLTGWQCAYCFKSPQELKSSTFFASDSLSEEPSTTTENNHNFTNDELVFRGISMQQRFLKIANEFKLVTRKSLDFQNPITIWRKLIFPDNKNKKQTTKTTKASSKKNKKQEDVFEEEEEEEEEMQQEHQSSKKNNNNEKSFHSQSEKSSSSSVLFLYSSFSSSRFLWILFFAISVPSLSAFPFILHKLHPSLHQSVPKIIWRKWFHFVAVSIFTVPTLTDASFMSLAWLGALGAVALIEAARFVDIPPFNQLSPLLESVTDDRDAVILRTHWYLMLGCALPVIFTQRTTYFWSDNYDHWLYSAALRILPGLGCLGVGDALSAVVGTLFGKHHSGKWASFFDPMKSITLRDNPVLKHKSRVGTLIGGCVLTFVVSMSCIAISKMIAEKMFVSYSSDDLLNNARTKDNIVTQFFSTFVIRYDWNETLMFLSKSAFLISFGAIFETVSGNVDNLEIPLIVMALGFLMF